MLRNSRQIGRVVAVAALAVAVLAVAYVLIGGEEDGDTTSSVLMMRKVLPTRVWPESEEQTVGARWKSRVAESAPRVGPLLGDLSRSRPAE